MTREQLLEQVMPEHARDDSQRDPLGQRAHCQWQADEMSRHQDHRHPLPLQGDKLWPADDVNPSSHTRRTRPKRLDQLEDSPEATLEMGAVCVCLPIKIPIRETGGQGGAERSPARTDPFQEESQHAAGNLAYCRGQPGNAPTGRIHDGQ